MVYVHYNMRLRLQHITEDQERDEGDFDPVDIGFSQYEDNPIMEWMQAVENQDPLLDEEGDLPRPYRFIAEEAGVTDVEGWAAEHVGGTRSARKIKSGRRDTHMEQQENSDQEFDRLMLGRAHQSQTRSQTSGGQASGGHLGIERGRQATSQAGSSRPATSQISSSRSIDPLEGLDKIDDDETR
ncbi:uncharacterized protein [Typha latifolia]|uniref:uncharacterized protein n=1 Tax=Typha latifolia TaxID=4733 RepID=UPI003C2DE5C8